MRGVSRLSAQEVLERIAKEQIEMVDLRIVDVPGRWQHMTIPATEISEATFRDGVPFDGSSLRGFRSIDRSDMLMRPDPGTAMVDPFAPVPTLALVADVLEPNGAEYGRDPRTVAARAERYLRTTGIADTSYWGPELEFFLFDQVGFQLDPHQAGYRLVSEESVWDPPNNSPHGYLIRPKQGYAPLPPHDATARTRTEIVQMLRRQGVRVEMHHHEVATGQQEIDLRYNTLVAQADTVMLYKYTVRNAARMHGKTATFMPKPLFGDNGSGMHVHQSLWRDGTPLFWEQGRYANLSPLAESYLAGILFHAPALLAFTNPTTNSYKRLVPGYEAPVNVVYSRGNRSAAIRIPVTERPEATRIEFRTPDPTANPYLAFAAVLMAGLDGIRRRLDPGSLGYGPVDKNIYELSPEEREGIASVPGSLDEALAALRADHAFLLEGGVFDRDLLDTWAELKAEDADAVRLRPHPAEFVLYYDA
jgi:glutamine synthetase